MLTQTCTHTHILRSGFTSVVAYLLTREVWNSRAGLLAACFMAIVPGYISRSVAGSYDNEGIAIFALLFTHFLWLKFVKTGSVFWSVAASLSYFYMVGCVEVVGVCMCGGGGSVHVWRWWECACVEVVRVCMCGGGHGEYIGYKLYCSHS